MNGRRGEDSGIIAVIIFTLLAVVSANAQTYVDLHDFNCAIEGCGPTNVSLLAQGRDGNIYGTASSGGTHGDGTVFKITPKGALITLYNFSGSDGYFPQGGLVLGMDGNLYGTTEFATNNAGTIFKITPAGILTTLHTFAGGTTDGAWPLTSPTLGSDGNLYGVTGVNQGTQTGIAYEYSPISGYKILGNLTNSLPGSAFWAPLIRGIDGSFYSTTYAGGTNGSGTVYSLSSTGSVNVIYDFDTTHGGWGYAPVVQDSQGNLYGTEAQGGTLGGGVVFKVTTAGGITTLNNFTDYCPGQSYGCVPVGGLVLGSDQNLYGSTYRGGPGNDGVLFKITKSGTYTQLVTLDGTDGAAIESTAIQHTNGIIYGVTSTGGAYGGGVLYSLNVGMKAFVALLFNSGKVGATVGVLGQGLKTTKSVLFNGKSATFKVVSNNYLTAVVPSGATTGFVTVKTSTSSFKSNRQFIVVP
jgi:uncharacterized repeat protein (TIGR03803 family)